MRKLFLIAIMILLTSGVQAQRITDFVVESGDIEIRFPGAADYAEGQWHVPTLVSAVRYSTEPLGIHVPRTKLGPQNWEFALQAIMPIFEKVQFTIQVDEIPYGFRLMELRGRVSEIVEGITYKNDWSVGDLKIIGKGSNPFHVQ